MSNGLFLIDKYNPKSLEDSFFHLDILEKLAHISIDECIPHLLFYGPPSSGKKAIINKFLEMVYNDSIYNITEEIRTISKPTTIEKTKKSGLMTKAKSIPVKVKRSNYHIVLEPGRYSSDKFLIQGIIKTYSSTKPLNVHEVKRPFKTIVINNADDLPYHTQTFLRRTIETNSKTCRYILCCQSLSKIIEPIQSRCYKIAIPKPSERELKNFLVHLSEKEKIVLSIKKMNNILKLSDGNIKRMIQLFECYQHGIEDTGYSYQEIVSEIVDLILNPSIKNILEITEKFYHIMITNFSCVKILLDIIEELLKKIKKDSVKKEIINRTQIDIHNLIQSRRPIYHLKSFVIHAAIIIYKNNK